LVDDAAQVPSAAFSSDGRLLAACVLTKEGQAEVRVWNVTPSGESPDASSYVRVAD